MKFNKQTNKILFLTTIYLLTAVNNLISQGSELFSEGLDLNERLFKINMNTTVYGYLIGADKNQETPKVVVRESAAKVTIGRERSVLDDEVPYHQNIKSKYRG